MTDEAIIYRMIDKQPGITQAELAERLGWHRQRVRRLLTVARKAGTHHPVWNHRSVVGWYHANVVAEVEAEAKAAALERKRARNANYSKRRWKSQQQIISDEFERMPIHRQVSAHAPLPFKCRAVPSVFHLGAA